MCEYLASLAACPAKMARVGFHGPLSTAEQKARGGKKRARRPPYAAQAVSGGWRGRGQMRIYT